eukprot:TRINITY_DN7227_c0_g2_i1.p5 TRINITY_DN7227_c0_g2~~TRINITY_DN7227_c0_g2_i1.p5  ORF type:complete len:103 (-),score=10.48 TRINITY_DN7227_c0_g2_i1:679-987(-)
MSSMKRSNMIDDTIQLVLLVRLVENYGAQIQVFIELNETIIFFLPCDGSMRAAGSISLEIYDEVGWKHHRIKTKSCWFDGTACITIPAIKIFESSEVIEAVG